MGWMTTKGKLELLRGTWSPGASSAAGKLRIVPVVSTPGAIDPQKTHQTMAAALAQAGYLEYPSGTGWNQTPSARPVVPVLTASQNDTTDTASVAAAVGISFGVLASIDSALGVYVGKRVRGCWVSYTVGASPNNAVDWPVYWIDGAAIEGENGNGQAVTFSWPDSVGTFSDSGAVKMFNVAKKELLKGTWAPESSSAVGNARLRVMPLIADDGTAAPDLALTTITAVLATAFDEYNGAGWSSVPLNRPTLRPLTAGLNGETGIPEATSLVATTGEIPLGSLSPATKPIQGLLVTYSVTSTPNNLVDFPVWYWPGVGVTGANGTGSAMFAHWIKGVLAIPDAA